ncbi:LOW QUALITY PROTEIN: hypothetical protein HID58_021465 [Brassica napus]|uniref:F-box domain-containing protein n=2 Tax=Brassica napus TaxID=3708 RepID=A0ABQ8CWI0_BRANA|nr:LOW QUALITY PROTEIN: hypothetical protein HID58_021465 [Brassica napus]
MKMIHRGPQHLDFESFTEYRDHDDTFLYPFIDYVPLNLYTSRTLVSLKLTFSGLEDPGFVSLPCLKSMTLVKVHFLYAAHLEKLVSGCPVLEELTLVRNMDPILVGTDEKIMRVRSGSLKRFRVPLWHGKLCRSSVKCTLEIDAPVLEHMTLGEDQYHSVMVKNLTSLFMVDLGIKFAVKFGEFVDPGEDFSKRNEIRYFLSGISSVKHMIISEKTVKVLELYSNVGMIPKFNNLSRLEAMFPCHSLHFLPAFLECCPSLKHLILEIYYPIETENVYQLANVPGCFLSTLECVQLKRIHVWGEQEMEVATYFLENAAVLKKLTLSLINYPRYVSDEEIFEESCKTFSNMVMPPRCDRISELPESLLTHILSFLPTSHSVETSVLSTRWKNLWLNVPSLDLNCDHFPYREGYVVISFFDRLLQFDPDSRLLKVKVKCGSVEIKGLKDRISTVIQRGPQVLDVESCTKYLDPDTQTYSPYLEFMPLNLYTSKTLVSLKLTRSGVEDPPGFVCMPCLKSMTLVAVHFRDDVTLEKLVSGCPVLEELTLIRDIYSCFVGEVDRSMSVRSGSLKRLRVPLWYGLSCSSSSAKCRLEIDAPGLEHMVLGEDQFESIVVHEKLTSLFMVDLNIKFGELFLYGISSVGHMIISEKTLKALELYSRVELIPKFNNLSRLEAVFPGNLLQFLPAFLECCPNLKHLILEVVYLREMDEEDAFELTNVPGCFLSTLECVELKRIHDWEEEEMRVATYFLENAAVLKKLTLSLTDYPRLISDEEIFVEVNKVTKRSPTCQILPD